MPRFLKRKSLPLACLLACGALPGAAFAAGQDAAKEIIAFEHARRDAIARVDLKALDRMTGQDLAYVDASGFERNKQQHLDHLAVEGVVYNSYSLDGLHAAVRGRLATLTGLFRFDVTVKGRHNAGNQYFTAVYLRTGKSWKLLIWHPTRATDLS